MTHPTPRSGESDTRGGPVGPHSDGAAIDADPPGDPAAIAAEPPRDPAATDADPPRQPAAIAADEVDAASRIYWEAEADAYQSEHGAFLANPLLATLVPAPHAGAVESVPSAAGFDSTSFVWGPEGLTEAEAGLLGPIANLAGQRVLEVGCGAAQCSRWLAQHGVHAVGIDLAVAQLRHARRALARSSGPPDAPAHDPGALMLVEEHHGTRLLPDGAWVRGPAAPAGASDHPGPNAPPHAKERLRHDGSVQLAAATATALPFGDATFDAAFSAYGAVQFVADLPRLLAQTRRVLRPGGRWVFAVTHPVRWAFLDDPGPEGLAVSGSYFDRTPYVERAVTDGTAVYAEFHRTIGDYVSALRHAGFTIEAMLEPEWPDWNDSTWGGWSPLRGLHLPGTLIFACRAEGA